MSVINQVLTDLEKRRASGAERSALPSHVRALPEHHRELPWARIGAGAAALLAALAVSWTLFSGLDWRPRAAPVPAPERGAEMAIEKVVAASAAGAARDARPGDGDDGMHKAALASRLSFELSSPPPESAAPAPRDPLRTSRVIGRGDAETSTAKSGAPAAPVERPGNAAPAPAVAKVPATKAEIQKEVRQPTPGELAENEFRKATASLHQRRLAESQEGFQAALNLYPGHLGARQALVGLLLETRKPGEAERVLQEGLALAPAQTGFAMTLARLQVDRGDAAAATATLKKGLEHAQAGADYLAFLAALLQRQSRHDEAIEQFQAALRARPAAGVWWLGLGLSLQAVNRVPEAQDAYRRANAANNLSPDLAAFAEQRLKQLQ